MWWNKAALNRRSLWMTSSERNEGRGAAAMGVRIHERWWRDVNCAFYCAAGKH